MQRFQRPGRAFHAALWISVIAALTLVGPGATLHAQTPDELIEQARASRDAGDFAAAAALVERYLASFPDAGGSWWMLAQLRYWMGDIEGSRRAYRRALQLVPGDGELRNDYARMLVGLGYLQEARQVVRPVARDAEPSARAEAERILADIRALTPPWLLARGSVVHDDQPRTQLELHAEAGAYLRPSWTLAASVTPRAFATGEGGAAPTRLDARLATSLASADGRVAVRGSGGAVLAEGGAQALYAGRATVRAARHVSLWAQLDRAAYEWTRASLDSLVMATAVEVALDAEGAPRWAGAARWRRDTFEDDNDVSTAFGWLLAPVVSGLRVGYSVSWQDARTSRWTRDPDAPSIPREVGRQDTIPGRYAPYYTPDDVLTHTLLVEGSSTVGPASVRVNGGFSFRGEEQAPVLIRGQGNALLVFTYDRTFSPWYAGLSMTRALGRGAQLELAGEYRRSTFYQVGRVSLGVLKNLR